MTLRLRQLRRLPSFGALQKEEDGRKRDSAPLLLSSSLSRLEEAATHRRTPSSAHWDGDAQFGEQWTRLRQVVNELFQSKWESRAGRQPTFQPGQLSSLHEDIHLLLLSKAGAFIFEFYQHSLVPAAAELMLAAVQQGPSDLATNLAATWQNFHTRVLPALEAIFVSVKNPRLSIRQATLLAFRDQIVLKLQPHLDQILSELFAEGSVHPALRQMFLVLQNVADCYPPSEQRLQLEALTARVVSPYQGFKGLYTDGQTKPTLPSKELEVAHLRRISVVDPRRLSRPLSVNSSLQMATLNDLFTVSLDRKFKRVGSREFFV